MNTQASQGCMYHISLKSFPRMNVYLKCKPGASFIDMYTGYTMQSPQLFKHHAHDINIAAFIQAIMYLYMIMLVLFLVVT